MTQRVVRAVGVALVAIGAWLPAHADLVPVGIDQPLTITQSGSYIVTQDIIAAAPPVIVVTAPNVAINLNGKTVGTTGGDTGHVIVMQTGAKQLRITNGTLSGGSTCLQSSIPGVRIVMDRVGCYAAVSGVHVNASQLTITHSVFQTSREAVHAGGRFFARFEDNTVYTTDYYSAGVSLLGMTAGSIARNTIGCSSYEGSLLTLEAFGYVRVDRNTLDGDNAAAGLTITNGVFSVTNNTIEGARNGAVIIQSSGSHVVNNTIRHAGGVCNAISVQGSDNLVSGNVIADYTVGIDVSGTNNVVSGNAVRGSWERGIFVNGSENTFSGNRVESQYGYYTTGLEFSATSSGNAYKSNVLTGNSGGGLLDNGTDNVDAGGNILDPVGETGGVE
jgi:parallel beta-helix repeat protein